MNKNKKQAHASNNDKEETRKETRNTEMEHGRKDDGHNAKQME